MLNNRKFKYTRLAISVHHILNMQSLNKIIYTSTFVGLFLSPIFTHAQAPIEEANRTAQMKNEQSKTVNINDTEVNSEQLLQQQIQQNNKLPALAPVDLTTLEDLPLIPVDQSMANEIYQMADEAKQSAQTGRNEAIAAANQVVPPVTEQQFEQSHQAPINVSALQQTIQSESQISVQPGSGNDNIFELTAAPKPEEEEKVGFFKRMINRLRPDNLLKDGPVVPRITAEVVGAPPLLTQNITAQLSGFTQEAFSDFSAVLPQLRNMSTQAAQAVGYYQATFKFEKINDKTVRVVVTPNDPVLVKSQELEFSGEGKGTPQFEVIRLVPDLEVGDILNQGFYEKTKDRINSAASENGYFDSYWRMHDILILQPQNTAQINLKYETGDRYKLGEVKFRMSNPSQPIPLDLDVLESLAPWKDGDDYTQWRVNALANNLTNSRYFNSTLVDTIRPDPITKPLELPPDLQALVDQQEKEQQLSRQANAVNGNGQTVADVTADETGVDESIFAGTGQTEQQRLQSRSMQVEQDQEDNERELLQQQAREQKKVPVIVTLNSDKKNNVEAGVGYGTDTKFRLRAQYRRPIVNRRGHSFDANLELSKIRQSIDGRYNIPYNNPLTDYISLVGGYERESLDDIGPGITLDTESAVVGAQRIIKNNLDDWQHSFGFRFRLDRLTQKGVVDLDQIPDAFKVPGSDREQQSLLFGYELSKTVSDNAVNPTRGYRQVYKVEAGSESLLSDANMAILTAGWRFIYSFGNNDNNQVIGRSDISYIFTNDFDKVPYNLRFFVGGDQTIRGFDYKSLSPEEYGFKVGGQGLAVGSLEYNYQFIENWRAAVFTDFGNAYNKDFSNPTAYSVGVGIRWRSPIGPIRLDVASGISDPNHPIRLHFFIGPSL